MHDFAQWLKRNSIVTALDDFAQDGSMYSFKLMNETKFIKIDKSFIIQIKKNRNHLFYLQGLVNTISLNGQKTIIEGIESMYDLQIARDVKCDYVQGYLFQDKNIIK